MRDVFFEECEDLIAALTEGLTAMRDGSTDSETVNAVFRAVHSVKGAAGAFALDDLVGFAHTFETVLDHVRSQRLMLDDRILHVLQRSGDVLADLIDTAREDLPTNTAQVDPVLADLQSFLGDAPAAADDFVFEALTLAFDAPADAASTHVVTFTPNAAFYTSGNDPVLVIAALQALGPSRVTVDMSALPTRLDDLNWQAGLLTWQVEIEGLGSDLPILEVFEFVDDLCALRVTSSDTEAMAPADQLATSSAQLPEDDTAEPASANLQGDTPDPKARNAADRSGGRAASSLRVDPERVDRLINAVGELIINQSVISQRLQHANLPNAAELFADLDDYKLLAREIQEGVMAIRAQPVKPLFQRMLRIAREAADATGKMVELITEGEGTEVDKTVVERLADPLTHMIRNAIDHGIEAPDRRVAAGKNRQGKLRLAARQRSGSIVIEIADDGAGLNRPKIREIAVSKGLVAEDAQLSETEIDHLLFAPGFSTAKEVTNLSGRGVGMDVVKTAITALGGRVAISSQFGQGTTFSITLPLTLAVMDGMIINLGDQTMVVPISSILETVRPKAADLSQIGLNNTLLRIRGEYVPIIDLAERMGQAVTSRDMTDRVLLLIQTDSIPQCALAVDDIFDQRQVVVKSMQGNYGEISGISGATILGDGKIALIIDPEAVAHGNTAYTVTNSHNGRDATYVTAC
ncbi:MULTISPECIES: chemotaxis protein CheA [unclassified Yoonia]|uniref:chemotaxis protein CheA n=1 Tax=unclassified Yoonia TaxID=2629118 RepID=UPI002AFF12B3|nr:MULTISPECIES: chemotaxis protein CheA [unclassified Yoonia]